jgi:hypothetical protein
MAGGHRPSVTQKPITSPFPRADLFIAHGIAIPVLMRCRGWHHHDLHHHPHPLRTLCLRHRRQSRSCGAGRHQHPLGDDENLHVDGLSLRPLVLPSRHRASTRRPTRRARWTSFYVIAAAVIGGTSLSGGVGTVAGAMLGALLMQSLQSGMVLLGIDTPLQNHRGRHSAGRGRMARHALSPSHAVIGGEKRWIKRKPL